MALARAAVLSSSPAAAAQADVTLEIGQTARANAFAQSATPTFDIETSAGAFAWSARDHRTFGLLRRSGSEYTPKPALVAYAVMTAQLSALSYEAADKTSAGIHSHGFTGDMRVMWAVNADQVVHLGTDQPLQVTDVMGRTATRAPENGRVTLTLSRAPQYVRGRVQSIAKGVR